MCDNLPARLQYGLGKNLSPEWERGAMAGTEVELGAVNLLHWDYGRVGRVDLTL
jgi:hypothetical protein